MSQENISYFINEVLAAASHPLAASSLTLEALKDALGWATYVENAFTSILEEARIQKRTSELDWWTSYLKEFPPLQIIGSQLNPQILSAPRSNEIEDLKNIGARRLLLQTLLQHRTLKQPILQRIIEEIASLPQSKTGFSLQTSSRASAETLDEEDHLNIIGSLLPSWHEPVISALQTQIKTVQRASLIRRLAEIAPFNAEFQLRAAEACVSAGSALQSQSEELPTINGIWRDLWKSSYRVPQLQARVSIPIRSCAVSLARRLVFLAWSSRPTRLNDVDFDQFDPVAADRVLLSLADSLATRADTDSGCALVLAIACILALQSHRTLSRAVAAKGDLFSRKLNSQDDVLPFCSCTISSLLELSVLSSEVSEGMLQRKTDDLIANQVATTSYLASFLLKIVTQPQVLLRILYLPVQVIVELARRSLLLLQRILDPLFAMLLQTVTFDEQEDFEAMYTSLNGDKTAASAEILYNTFILSANNITSDKSDVRGDLSVSLLLTATEPLLNVPRIPDNFATISQHADGASGLFTLQSLSTAFKERLARARLLLHIIHRIADATGYFHVPFSMRRLPDIRLSLHRWQVKSSEELSANKQNYEALLPCMFVGSDLEKVPPTPLRDQDSSLKAFDPTSSNVSLPDDVNHEIDPATVELASRTLAAFAVSFARKAREHAAPRLVMCQMPSNYSRITNSSDVLIEYLRTINVCLPYGCYLVRSSKLTDTTSNQN